MKHSLNRQQDFPTHLGTTATHKGLRILPYQTPIKPTNPITKIHNLYHTYTKEISLLTPKLLRYITHIKTSPKLPSHNGAYKTRNPKTIPEYSCSQSMHKLLPVPAGWGSALSSQHDRCAQTSWLVQGCPKVSSVDLKKRVTILVMIRMVVMVTNVHTG